MFKRSAILLVLTLLTGSVIGCATSPKAESDLDAKVKAEPTANTPADIEQRAAEAFSNSPGLTPDQKLKLATVYSRTYADAMAIREEIGKSKSLLFKTIAKSKYDSKDVEALKKKIVGLDHRRLQVMFKALADVQNIVGYGEDKSEFYRHFQDYEMPHGQIISGRK